jgi:hypothetical protein
VDTELSLGIQHRLALITKPFLCSGSLSIHSRHRRRAELCVDFHDRRVVPAIILPSRTAFRPHCVPRLARISASAKNAPNTQTANPQIETRMLQRICRAVAWRTRLSTTRAHKGGTPAILAT